VTSSRRFRFVQVEYPWALGPEPGRYTIREHLGEGPRHILVLAVLGAPERRRLARRHRRARDAAPEPPPEPVTTSRATLIDAIALEGQEAADRWLRATDVAAAAAEGIARLNRVLHAQRIATADPYARDVSLPQALAVRVGYGTGEHVADGRWDRARELSRAAAGGTRRGGRAALRPQERLAAALGARDALLAGEELTLRARSDVDAERWREAALQLGVAFETTLAELEPWREVTGLSARLDELHARGDDVRAAAGAALQGGLEQHDIAVVRTALGRLEAALRARTAGGI
jgi:hypothetical protein